MPHSYGYRAHTRSLFKKDFKTKGMPHLSTYLTTYRIGDLVDIKADSAVQKGMPHKFYHGKTGVVFNVTPRAVGVIVRKIIGNRYLEKRVNVRVEHVKHSKCRQDMQVRMKENIEKIKTAKAAGESVNIKRLPAQPREGHTVSIEHNLPTTLRPLPFETTI